MANNSNMIIKSIAVLRAFTDVQQEWGVNELARYMSMPVSSLHRILKSLRDQGLLDILPQSNKYSFGPEFIRMSAIVQSKSNLNMVAKPIIQHLSQQLDETIYLALYYPAYFRLAFIDIVQSSRKLQYMLELGVHYPIHIAASGKAILSQLPAPTIAQLIAQENLSATGADQLIQLLHQFNQQGYAESISERQSDSYGISAPFFDASGDVVGSITCAIPVPFFDDARKPGIVEAVKSAALSLSRQLGYIGR